MTLEGACNGLIGRAAGMREPVPYRRLNQRHGLRGTEYWLLVLAASAWTTTISLRRRRVVAARSRLGLRSCRRRRCVMPAAAPAVSASLESSWECALPACVQKWAA